MATDHTNVRSEFESVSECARILRTANYVDIVETDVVGGEFEAVNPVPLTVGADRFAETVRTVADRFGLAVHATDNPFRLIVSGR